MTTPSTQTPVESGAVAAPAAACTTASDESVQMTPVVINMGKNKKRKARKIQKGKGPVQNHVDRAVQYAAECLGDDGKGKVFVPVVLVYRKKQKKSKRFW